MNETEHNPFCSFAYLSSFSDEEKLRRKIVFGYIFGPLAIIGLVSSVLLAVYFKRSEEAKRYRLHLLIISVSDVVLCVGFLFGQTFAAIVSDYPSGGLQNFEVVATYISAHISKVGGFMITYLLLLGSSENILCFPLPSVKRLIWLGVLIFLAVTVDLIPMAAGVKISQIDCKDGVRLLLEPSLLAMNTSWHRLVKFLNIVFRLLIPFIGLILTVVGSAVRLVSSNPRDSSKKVQRKFWILFGVLSYIHWLFLVPYMTTIAMEMRAESLGNYYALLADSTWAFCIIDILLRDITHIAVFSQCGRVSCARRNN